MKAKVLEVVTANMLSLYMKAKCFHLNVTGPRFYGDHKTYDGIADVALEWFDVLAERMRALDEEVESSPKWAISLSVMADTAKSTSDAESMAEDMLAGLEAISEYINAKLNEADNTTQNILQEVDAALGKQMYFVRSSL